MNGLAAQCLANNVPDPGATFQLPIAPGLGVCLHLL